jgi:hypothetical protein
MKVAELVTSMYVCARVRAYVCAGVPVSSQEAVTVPITDTHVCIAREDYSWLPPRDAAAAASTVSSSLPTAASLSTLTSNQFTLVSRQRINNLTSVVRNYVTYVLSSVPAASCFTIKNLGYISQQTADYVIFNERVRVMCVTGDKPQSADSRVFALPR